MNNKHFLMISILAVFLLSLPFANLNAQSRSSSSAKKIYCYNDEEGRRVCSDALPPEASSRARTEINSRTGIVTRQVDRALTEDEIDELARQEAMQAEKERMEAENLRKMEIFVGNYHDEREIENNYAAKISQYESQISFSKNAMAQVRGTLASQLKRLADIELNNHTPPQNIVDEMMKTRQSMLNHQRNIDNMNASIQEAQREKELAILTFRQYNRM